MNPHYKVFRDYRAIQQAKRDANRQRSTDILRQRGLHLTSHNEGFHLIVEDRWDFWPGTGMWLERRARPGQPRRQGRGVFDLIRNIEEDAHAPQ